MRDHEIDRLIDDGLARYGRGDVDGALMAWEQVLAEHPADVRAARYVDYVRAHYDQLTGGAGAALAELLVPFPLAGGDDSGEYEVEITRDPLPFDRLAEPAIDDGWWLAPEDTGVIAIPTGLAASSSPGLSLELDADEPPLPEPSLPEPLLPDPARPGLAHRADRPRRSSSPPASSLFGDDDAMTTDYASLSLGRPDLPRGLPLPPRPPTDGADDSGEATFGGYRGARPGPLELDLDLGPSLAGPAFAGPAAPSRGSQDFHEREPSIELTTERPVGNPGRAATTDLTAERSATGAGSALPGIADLSLDLEPMGAASELGIEAHVPAAADTGRSRAELAARFDDVRVPVEELRLPPPPSLHRPVDDDEPVVAARPPAVTVGSAGELLALADRDRRPGEALDDTARRRIGFLIEHARAAAGRGDHDQVAIAIDLALAESPDSAVAQKLIHKHRDVLLDCYYRYFGALDRRPVAAGNITAAVGLEPRAAFLWSRIDGMLTFDELLDVAGMGRLEACRHLAQLMRRGLVRSEA